LFNSNKARRPVMNKTLELISLDDSELLEVTGGCKPRCCAPPPPPPCGCEPVLVVGVVVGIAF
jgi:hypothetical protein